MSAQLGPRSITGKLLMAILAVFLLAMALQYAAYYENLESRQALVHACVESKARASAAAVDDALEDSMAELRVAWSLRGERASEDRILDSLMAQHAQWIGTGHIDLPSGDLRCAPATLPEAVAESLVNSDAQTRPTVSPVLRIEGKPAFVVSVPVAGKSPEPGIAYAVIAADALKQPLERTVGGSLFVQVNDGRNNRVCCSGTIPPNRNPLTSRAQSASAALDRRLSTSMISSGSGWQVSIVDPSAVIATDGAWFVRSVLISLLAAGLALMLGKRITSPIKKLSRAAAAVAVGDFRRRVTINTGDELQSLAESFNRMAENLEEHEEQLRMKTRVQQTLFELAGTITSSLDLNKVAESISQALKQHFSARQVVIFRLNEATGKVEPIPSETDQGIIEGGPLHRLAEHAINSPSVISMPATISYPQEGQDGGTAVALPLIVGNQRVGVLAATLSPDEPWDVEMKNRIELLETFASWAATALQNASVHGRTEDFMRMLNSLRRVVEAISSSLDLKQVMRALVRTTCEVMGAKACAIILADQTGKLEVAESHNLSEEFSAKLKLMPGEPWSGMAFSEKRPIVRPDVCADSELRLRQEAEREGLHGFVCAPMIVADEAIGTINVWMSEPHSAKAMDVHLLTSIAGHAAAVIGNAKLFGKEYQIAETLQSTLKGEVPGRLGKLSFGHKYIPGLDEASVGGDLYDVVSLPNGKVALIVADVTGKGIQAAVHTAMIRYMTRAYLFQWPDSPGHALSQLNRAVQNYAGDKVLVTVLCAVIDAETGRMSYSNAGHPPAIVITREGKQQILLYRTGMPIGYSDDSDYSDREVALMPGDMLFLYTDGIIEAKRDGQVLSIEGLEDILFQHSAQSPVVLVETVCEETSKFANRALKDDIALVAAGFER